MIHTEAKQFKYEEIYVDNVNTHKRMKTVRQKGLWQ